MIKAVDPYLHAAEGFLHAVRDDIDKLDLRLDDSLKIAAVYAQVSLARSLRELADATIERAGQHAAGQHAADQSNGGPVRHPDQAPLPI